MNLEELKEMQEEKIQSSNKEQPTWVYYDDKGNIKINVPKLSYEIISEIPMIRADSVPMGARFDKETGSWRLDGLNEFIDGYITQKLEMVDLWSQQKLGEIRKFVTIKAFDSELINNPFDNSDPYLVNFKNGTYDIRTDEMKKHDVKDYILQNHNYEIDIKGAGTPLNTLSWLEDLTESKETAMYLCEMIGHCFYRGYNKFQNVTILHGDGGNGKSTFINLIEKLLTGGNVSNVSLDMLGDKNNRFASSLLYQKEANMFADIGAEFIKSTSLIKALTGEDKIMAEFKGVTGFMFVNFAKLIFSCNSLPQTNDFTKGFDRRLYVVPFHKKIDSEFMKKHDLKAIQKEISDFSLYCLRSFKKALDRGNLTVSEDMLEIKDKWLKESNHVLRFLEERCEIDMESNIGDSSKTIYETYQKYCFQESLKELSQPKFTKQLENHGIFKKNPRANGSRIQRYIHLTLKNEY